MRICRSLLFTGVVSCWLISLALWGQQNAVPDSTVDSVSAQLQLLTHLPADEWRYHVGDLAHGEDPNLDDSGWQLVKPKFDGPEDSAWFRRWIEVPKNLNGYDLTGTKLWFQFLAYGNGPIPEIVYFNGRRVAMGEDLEPIILLDPVKPGDRVLVAVKLLHTVDKKRFEGATVRVDFAQ